MLVQRMKNGPFSLSTDGSNDQNAKQFPLVVRSLSEDGKVTSELLSVPVVTGSATGEVIFRAIEAEFEKYELNWSNCISFGCDNDNANVMVGQQTGVIKFMR